MAKVCFVSVGATTTFTRLVEAVLSEPFLDALARERYTHLRVQYGIDGQDTFDDCLRILTLGSSSKVPGNMDISGFSLAPDQDKLQEEIKMTQASKQHGRSMGMFVTHAGR
jgi:beta-1,4-N-acetylglucosaminyltransferase